MADITFPKELIQRLEAIAKQENRTPAEVLSSMIDRYLSERSLSLPDNTIRETGIPTDSDNHEGRMKLA